MKNKSFFLGGWLSIVIYLTFFTYVNAAEKNSQDSQSIPMLKIYNQFLMVEKEVSVLNKEFLGITDFVFADLGLDGVPELVVSYGYQNKPVVKIFRLDGSLVNEWQPYPDGFEGRISVAAADFDADKQMEIVTIAGEGGGPQVRIFDGFGQPKFNNGFFVGDQKYRMGAEIAIGDINKDLGQEIIVSMIGENKNIIKIYDHVGRQLYNTIEFTADQYYEPVKLAVADINGDSLSEIIVGSSLGNKPKVIVFNYLGEELSSFMAYGEAFLGGIDVATVDFGTEKLIVTGAGYSGGPHVRFFDFYGNVKLDPRFFVYDNNFRGGLNVSGFTFGEVKYLGVLAQTQNGTGNISGFGKVIRVDISEQKLYTYNKGRLVKSFLISSGKFGFDTPYGIFKVYKKIRNTRMSWNYGPNNPNNYDLPNVPHVLAFYGAYTIHGAYWHNNWGRRMSHGCINVSLPNAKWLYEWTPIGTPVIIER